jgi:hypothetical protein
MKLQTRNSSVPTVELILASLLLAGVLALAYGVFGPSTVGFYTGLIVIIGGVLTGVARILARFTAAGAR